MSMLIIAFVAAWILRHWWDGRRTDYRDPNNGYQQCAGRQAPPRSGPDIRYALGWSAYQLRHGWPAMAEDVRRGWNDANTNYQAWREGDEDDRAGMFAAWKRGWRQARRKLPKTRRQQRATEDKAAETAKPTAAPHPEPATQTRPPLPLPNQPSQNGDRMTAGDINGISAYRAKLNETIRNASQQIDETQAELVANDNKISEAEHTYAQLTDMGLGTETTGRVTEIMEALLSHKAALGQELAAAEKEKADAEQALADLDQQGHTTIEESVKGATARVAKTDFYRN